MLHLAFRFFSALFANPQIPNSEGGRAAGGAERAPRAAAAPRPRAPPRGSDSGLGADRSSGVGRMFFAGEVVAAETNSAQDIPRPLFFALQGVVDSDNSFKPSFCSTISSKEGSMKEWGSFP